MTLWLVCPLPHDKNDVYGVGAKGYRRWFYLNPAVATWRDAQRARWLSCPEETPGWLGPPIEIDFHVHLPAGWEGRKWDVDHATSNLLDTLTGVLYEDDAVVFSEWSTKTYDAPGGEPYVDIHVFAPPVL